MEDVLSTNQWEREQDRRLRDVMDREQSRLRNFIRQRVPDELDAEDILQDAFYELLLAYRLLKPVEQAGAWLFRVARNRIVDRFRKKRPERFGDQPPHQSGGDEPLGWEELLPSPAAGPDAAYARKVLLEELDAALDELPEDQRAVFAAHELEGKSFKQLSAESGVSVNTLLSRKHAAVVRLRRRLRSIYEEFAGV